MTDIITNKGMEMEQPVKCTFIFDGQEYTSKISSLKGDISAIFNFETSAKPDTVIFYPDNKVKIGCK
jgi:hypothetical protein